MRLLFERVKVVAEPSGATALAALLAGRARAARRHGGRGHQRRQRRRRALRRPHRGLIRHPPSRTAGPLYRGRPCSRPCACARPRSRPPPCSPRPPRAQAPVPTPVAPADGATAQAGAPLTFTARGQGALVVRVARSPAAVDGCGAIAEDGGRFDGAPSPARPDARAVHRARRPRRRRVVLAGRQPGGLQRRAGAPHHRRRVRCDDAGDARHAGGHPTPAPAGSAAQARARPDPVAHRHQQPRAARPCAGRGLALGLAQPPVALVRNSARRWRLDARGPVKRVPRLGDGHDDVGFAAALVSQGALGTTTLLRQNYVRVRRVCAASGLPHDRVRRPARASSSATSRCCPTCPGQQGPAHPTSEEYDLETVVLHELGHWAGNLRHTPVGCHDTPMVKGLGPGEWWRSSSDWHYDACGAGRARAASALDVPSLTAPRPLHHRARRRADRRRPLDDEDPSASSGRPVSSTTATARSPSTASRSTIRLAQGRPDPGRPDRSQRRPPRRRAQQRLSASVGGDGRRPSARAARAGRAADPGVGRAPDGVPAPLRGRLRRGVHHPPGLRRRAAGARLASRGGARRVRGRSVGRPARREPRAAAPGGGPALDPLRRRRRAPAHPPAHARLLPRRADRRLSRRDPTRSPSSTSRAGRAGARCKRWG